MPLIATRIEPQRVTRIFLDCRDAPPDPADRLRIERAIEDSVALAKSMEDALSQHETIGASTLRSSPLEDASRYSEPPAWLRARLHAHGGRRCQAALSDDWGGCQLADGHQPAANGGSNA
jgi:hypothetical protein